MEKAIRNVTDNITGGILGDDEERSILTQCAVEVATIALTAYKDNLRQKALKLASAIADFEDELNSLATVKGE